MDLQNIALGTLDGTRYCPAADCLDTLVQLGPHLDEDIDFQFRIKIVSSKFFENQLVQLLVHVGQENEDELSILLQLIKVLCQMTAPFESFTNAAAPVGSLAYTAQKHFLSLVKHVFRESRVTWPILSLLKLKLNPSLEETAAKIDYEAVKDCLQLIINLLSISDDEVCSTAAAVIANLQKPSERYGFVWYLLYQNFDTVVINLCKAHRCTEQVMKIIILLYKGVETWKIKHHLMDWICQSISSSESYPDSTVHTNSNNGQTTFPEEDQSSLSSKERSGYGVSGSSGGAGSSPSQTEVVNSPDTLSLSSQNASPNSGTMAPMDIPDSGTLAPKEIKTTRDQEGSEEEPEMKRHKVTEDFYSRKRKSKKERDQHYRDLGFYSGVNEETESEGPDPRLIRNSELSDNGYFSNNICDFEEIKKVKFDPSKLSPMARHQHSMKLLERRVEHNKTTSRSLVYQVATELDVLAILTEFTIDFLLKGYRKLLADVQEIIAKDQINTFRFKEFYSWMVYYFLPMTADLGIPLKHISLQYDTIHYIIAETLLNAIKITVSTNPLPLNLKLVAGFVRAQQSFVETINRYMENTFTEQQDRTNLKNIQLQIIQTKNIRQLYVLLTKLATDEKMLSRKYLSHLVETNHMHLTMIQQLASQDTRTHINLASHIEQFASTDMMKPYIFLLESFSENSNTVNDCVFTMMHHIVGDLSSPQALDVDSLHSTIRKILNQQDLSLCDDWKDLLEYMIVYFTTKKVTVEAHPTNPEPSPISAEGSKKSGTKRRLSRTGFVGPNAANSSAFSETEDCTASQNTCSWISSLDIDPDMIHQDTALDDSGWSTDDSFGASDVQSQPKPPNPDEIKKLTRVLSENGQGDLVDWLQGSLLDAWRVKLDVGTLYPDRVPLEPLPYYCHARGLRIPLLMFNSRLIHCNQNEDFLNLARELGLEIVGRLVFIPCKLQTSHILQGALALGPVSHTPLFPELNHADP